MYKYAKIMDNDTKQVMVGIGSNEKFYRSLEMELLDIEQAYNEMWYLKGFAPEKPEEKYTEKRSAEYPDIREFIDAQVKINSNDETLVSAGLEQLKEYITKCLEVKNKYPKQPTDSNE